MGGPIDTRVNPTVVNRLAERRGIDWFRRNVITKVPFPNPGFMRDVYPGFLQLNGFVSMNLDRHIEAHRKLFQHLVAGDGDSAQKHREFYDEISRRDGSVRRVLSRRPSTPCSSATRLPHGRDDPSRSTGRSGRHPPRRACSPSKASTTTFPASARPRPRIGCASTFPPEREGALAAAGRRSLRRVQRLALPRRDRAAHRRLRAVDGSAARARGRLSGRVVQKPRSLHNGGGAGPRRLASSVRPLPHP